MHPSEAQGPITPRVALWELEQDISSPVNSLSCGLLDGDTYNHLLPENVRIKVSDIERL